MAKAAESLPRGWQLQKHIKELISLSTITPVPGNIVGFQQLLEDRLHVRLETLLKTPTD